MQVLALICLVILALSLFMVVKLLATRQSRRMVLGWVVPLVLAVGFTVFYFWPRSFPWAVPPERTQIHYLGGERPDPETPEARAQLLDALGDLTLHRVFFNARPAGYSTGYDYSLTLRLTDSSPDGADPLEVTVFYRANGQPVTLETDDPHLICKELHSFSLP